MWVLFLLLKITGFILLFLLCLCLIIIAAVLFSPIRYYAKGVYDGCVNASFNVFIWFKMIGLKYNCLDNASDIKIVIFWKSLDFDSLFGNEKKHKKPKKRKQKKEKERNKALELKKTERTQSRTVESKKKQSDKGFKGDKGKKEKHKDIKPKKINDRNIHFGDTLGIIKEKYNAFKAVENKKEIIKYSFQLLNRLLKALKNKIFNIKINFGFGEPDKTGIVLGIGCAANAMLPVNIELEPNFEKECFSFNGEIKGRTSLFGLVLPIIIYIFKKPVWNLIFNGKEED